jgi:hypothetical protein
LKGNNPVRTSKRIFLVCLIVLSSAAFADDSQPLKSEGKGNNAEKEKAPAPGPLSGYQRLDKPPVERPSIVNAHFDDGAKGWSLPEGYSIDAHGGRNGTGGLLYERADPEKYSLAKQSVRLVPGARYRFGAWIRTEKVTGGKASICLEFRKDDKWLSGVYLSAGVDGTRDWTWVGGSGTVPATAEGQSITPYLQPKATGKVWFDDVIIEPEAPAWTVYMISPAFETISSDDGRITLGSFYVPVVKWDTPEMACLVQAEAGGRILGETISPVSGNRVLADVGRLPEGPALLRLSLLKPDLRQILDERTIPVTVASPSRTIPGNACMIDNRGRAIVGGAPFLPVGLYFDNLPDTEFERLWKSPFNTIMPYNIKFQIKGKEKREMFSEKSLLDTYDACHAHGVKVIFPLHTVYDIDYSWVTREWLGAAGPDAVIKKAADLLRGHPAHLAWYISDECPVEMIPALTARRRELNRLDPFHPVWTVQMQFSDLPFYGPTCDVLGVDRYPIKDERDYDLSSIQYVMDMAELAVGAPGGGLALWVVPQIINWGNYLAKNNPEARKKYRYPTEEELRAMSLLMALRGAKGFIYYAYHDFLKKEAVREGDLEREWPKVCRVAAEMVSLAPFLLSDTASESVDLEPEKGAVLARKFSDGRGRVRIIIAGAALGLNRAVIKTPPGVLLNSKYGHCVRIGDGRHRFEGANMSSDVLESDDVSHGKGN